MWKKILIYLAVINYFSRFVTGSKEISKTAGIIIEEVCLPQQIAELERYLDEFDLPEVPISNTATYRQNLGIDDGAVPELGKLHPHSALAVKEIELMPLGALPVDLKRLRILHDLLILPEDGELKSKLAIIYKILIAANQRLRKSEINTLLYGETHTQRIETAKNTPNYLGDGKIDSSGSEKAEDRRNFSTTRRQRSERSTYNQNYGYTDSSNPKYQKEDRVSPPSSSSSSSSSSSPMMQETLNFDDENLGRYGEISGESNPESNTAIPQIKEVGEIFKDSESGGGIIESFDGVVKADNHQLETTDSSLKETSTSSNLNKINTDSNFEGMITDSKFEKSFTDTNFKGINTDSIPERVIIDLNSEVAVTDSNFNETIIDSKFEESFTELNSKETSTDSTPRSTFTDSNLKVAVTDSKFKETIIDSRFEDSFTESNSKETSTDSTPKSTPTDSNFEVSVTDSNLKETITDSNFEESFTESNSKETSTDSSPKITPTDSNFEVSVTDSNSKETITDSKFEESFIESKLKETSTDSTPKSTPTDSNFEVAVTDSNFETTVVDSEFEESFEAQNSRKTATSINPEEAVTDSSLKSTVMDLKLINTVTDSNLGEIVTDTNLKEAITSSNLIKIVTEYPTSKLNYIELSTVENLHSKEPEYKLIKGEDQEEDSEEAKVTGFENRKSSEHVASETINEMRSPSPEGSWVTTKEIKPDVRNEDLETRITTLSDPFIRSSLLLPIDQKTNRHFGGESSSPPYFTTPSYTGDKNLKIYLNYNKGLDNPASNSPADKEDLATSATTRKTLILNIAESFSNIPRPVEVALFKKKDRKSGNHISGMRNYEDEKNSRLANPPPQGTGFYKKNRHRVGQESGGKLSGNRLYGFKNFRRNNSTGRHVKRGGHNTDVEKLYRWFYRGGDIPGKSMPGGAEVECNHRN